MTKAHLMELVKLIPDDADIMISGCDFSGYDVEDGDTGILSLRNGKHLLSGIQSQGSEDKSWKVIQGLYGPRNGATVLHVSNLH